MDIDTLFDQQRAWPQTATSTLPLSSSETSTSWTDFLFIYFFLLEGGGGHTSVSYLHNPLKKIKNQGQLTKPRKSPNQIFQHFSKLVAASNQKEQCRVCQTTADWINSSFWFLLSIGGLDELDTDCPWDPPTGSAIQVEPLLPLSIKSLLLAAKTPDSNWWCPSLPWKPQPQMSIFFATASFSNCGLR